MNNILRLKISEKFMTNGAFAAASGIHESTISKIILGTRTPTESQKAIMASLLRMKKDDLFPSDFSKMKVEVIVSRKEDNGKGSAAKE